MANALRKNVHDPVGSLADELLTNSYDHTTDPALNRNIQELREKIKTARLEKLMARQLESELSIEGLEPLMETLSDDDFDRWIMSEEIEFPDPDASSNENIPHAAAPEPVAPAPVATIAPVAPLPPVEKPRDEIVDINEMIQTGMEMVSKLDEQSRVLKTSMGRFEQGFSKLSETQRKLEQTERQNAKLEQDIKENSIHSAQQRKQISILEARVSKATTEAAQYRTRMISVQEKFDELNRRSLDQQSTHHNRVQELEYRLREMHGELEANKRDKLQAIAELKAANSLLALHDEMMETLSEGAARD